MSSFDIDVLSIGDELLDASVREGNGLFLADLLANHGLRVRRHLLVRDTVDDIVAALRAIGQRAHACVVSGGLGPTDDDRTAEAAARAAEVDLIRHHSWVERIEQMFSALGREMGENNARQADLPVEAELITNHRGTAPAFSMAIGDCRFFFLPGVPREYRPLCEEVVVPRLVAAASPEPVTVVSLRTFGLPESEVDRALAELLDEPGLSIGYRASFPEVQVRLRMRGAEASDRMIRVRRRATELLDGRVFAEGDTSLAKALVEALRRRDATLAVAESCTGGGIGQLITDVPGASSVFLGGALCYSNALKQEFASVPHELLEAHGAVSEAVARAMAEGIRERCGASYGLGVTGIAGPGGGSVDKPVGLVCVAVAGPSRTEHRRWRAPGDRERVRRLAAFVGLDMVRRMVLEESRVD